MDGEKVGYEVKKYTNDEEKVMTKRIKYNNNNDRTGNDGGDDRVKGNKK